MCWIFEERDLGVMHDSFKPGSKSPFGVMVFAMLIKTMQSLVQRGGRLLQCLTLPAGVHLRLQITWIGYSKSKHLDMENTKLGCGPSSLKKVVMMISTIHHRFLS